MLNKLVRDKVFDSIVELEQRPEYRILKKKEFLHCLQEKLLEEAKELDPSQPDAIDELADILEAVEYIAKQLGIDYAQLRTLQLARRQRRGGFKKRIFIKTLTLKASDPWANYYAKHPERFPEIVPNHGVKKAD